MLVVFPLSCVALQMNIPVTDCGSFAEGAAPAEAPASFTAEAGLSDPFPERADFSHSNMSTYLNAWVHCRLASVCLVASLPAVCHHGQKLAGDIGIIKRLAWAEFIVNLKKQIFDTLMNTNIMTIGIR